ncbi:HAD family hydrolase [Enterobacter hormaechei]
MKKLLITDLDNTLYDWVSFYAQSFTSLLNELSIILGVDKEILIKEFKQVHKFHGNSEYPFGALELPSVISKFKSNDKVFLSKKVDSAFHAFNSTRNKTLTCYSNVLSTLQEISSSGIVIVGHTEAPVRNALFRLEKLGLIKYFKHLYTPHDRYHDDLNDKTKQWLSSYGDFLILLNEKQKKPNPELLIDICSSEGVEKEDAVYIGDSIVKDIAMANLAGIDSVWAEYGKQHSQKYWDVLVSITHWTEEDVARETRLKVELGKQKPTYTISSFDELKDILF